MTAEGGYMEKVLPVMQERFPELNIFRSEPYFLEIMPQDVDKAFSLAKLLEFMGLTRKQMICCGDGYNDVSMMRYAGLGVAMANAQPEVKKEADYITASNDEDGIAQVIEKFIEID
jgi:Cof subfamily protein (haloacid dehalogenase superfamily)